MDDQLEPTRLWCETCRDSHGPSGPHVGEVIAPDKAELLREIDRQHAAELDEAFGVMMDTRNEEVGLGGGGVSFPSADDAERTPSPQNLPDDELLAMWRSVRGPLAELNGPLIRYAGLAYRAGLAKAKG